MAQQLQLERNVLKLLDRTEPASVMHAFECIIDAVESGAGILSHHPVPASAIRNLIPRQALFDPEDEGRRFLAARLVPRTMELMQCSWPEEDYMLEEVAGSVTLLRADAARYYSLVILAHILHEKVTSPDFSVTAMEATPLTPPPSQEHPPATSEATDQPHTLARQQQAAAWPSSVEFFGTPPSRSVMCEDDDLLLLGEDATYSATVRHALHALGGVALLLENLQRDIPALCRAAVHALQLLLCWSVPSGGWLQQQQDLSPARQTLRLNDRVLAELQEQLLPILMGVVKKHGHDAEWSEALEAIMILMRLLTSVGQGHPSLVWTLAEGLPQVSSLLSNLLGSADMAVRSQAVMLLQVYIGSCDVWAPLLGVCPDVVVHMASCGVLMQAAMLMEGGTQLQPAAQRMLCSMLHGIARFTPPVHLPSPPSVQQLPGSHDGSNADAVASDTAGNGGEDQQQQQHQEATGSGQTEQVQHENGQEQRGQEAHEQHAGGLAGGCCLASGEGLRVLVQVLSSLEKLIQGESTTTMAAAVQLLQYLLLGHIRRPAASTTSFTITVHAIFHPSSMRKLLPASLISRLTAHLEVLGQEDMLAFLSACLVLWATSSDQPLDEALAPHLADALDAASGCFSTLLAGNLWQVRAALEALQLLLQLDVRSPLAATEAPGGCHEGGRGAPADDSEAQPGLEVEAEAAAGTPFGQALGVAVVTASLLQATQGAEDTGADGPMDVGVEQRAFQHLLTCGTLQHLARQLLMWQEWGLEMWHMGCSALAGSVQRCRRYGYQDPEAYASLLAEAVAVCQQVLECDRLPVVHGMVRTLAQLAVLQPLLSAASAGDIGSSRGSSRPVSPHEPGSPGLQEDVVDPEVGSQAVEYPSPCPEASSQLLESGLLLQLATRLGQWQAMDLSTRLEACQLISVIARHQHQQDLSARNSAARGEQGGGEGPQSMSDYGVPATPKGPPLPSPLQQVVQAACRSVASLLQLDGDLAVQAGLQAMHRLTWTVSTPLHAAMPPSALPCRPVLEAMPQAGVFTMCAGRLLRWHVLQLPSWRDAVLWFRALAKRGSVQLSCQTDLKALDAALTKALDSADPKEVAAALQTLTLLTEPQGGGALSGSQRPSYRRVQTLQSPHEDASQRRGKGPGRSLVGGAYGQSARFVSRGHGSTAQSGLSHMVPLLGACVQKLSQKGVSWQAVDTGVLVQLLRVLHQCGGDQLSGVARSVVGLLGALMDRGPNAESMVVKALEALLEVCRLDCEWQPALPDYVCKRKVVADSLSTSVVLQQATRAMRQPGGLSHRALDLLVTVLLQLAEADPSDPSVGGSVAAYGAQALRRLAAGAVTTMPGVTKQMPPQAGASAKVIRFFFQRFRSEVLAAGFASGTPHLEHGWDAAAGAHLESWQLYCSQVVGLVADWCADGPNFQSGKQLLMHILPSLLQMLQPLNAASATLQLQHAIAAGCLLQLVGPACKPVLPDPDQMKYNYVHHVLLRGESWRQVMQPADRALLLVLQAPLGADDCLGVEAMHSSGLSLAATQEMFEAVAQHPILIMFARLLQQVPTHLDLPTASRLCRVLRDLHSRPDIGAHGSLLRHVLHHAAASLDRLIELDRPQAAQLLMDLAGAYPCPSSREGGQAGQAGTEGPASPLVLSPEPSNLGPMTPRAPQGQRGGSAGARRSEPGAAPMGASIFNLAEQECGDACSPGCAVVYPGIRGRGLGLTAGRPTAPCAPIAQALLHGGTLLRLLQRLPRWKEPSTAVPACIAACQALHAITRWLQLGHAHMTGGPEALPQTPGGSGSTAVSSNDLPPALREAMRQAATCLATLLKPSTPSQPQPELVRGALQAVWELHAASGAVCWPATDELLAQGVLLQAAKHVGNAELAQPHHLPAMVSMVLSLVDRCLSSSGGSQPEHPDAPPHSLLGQAHPVALPGEVRELLWQTSVSLGRLLASGPPALASVALQAVWDLSRIQIKVPGALLDLDGLTSPPGSGALSPPNPASADLEAGPDSPGQGTQGFLSQAGLSGLEPQDAEGACMPAVHALLGCGTLTTLTELCCRSTASSADLMRTCSLVHLLACQHAGRAAASHGSSIRGHASDTTTTAAAGSSTAQQRGSPGGNRTSGFGDSAELDVAGDPGSSSANDRELLAAVLQQLCSLLCGQLGSLEQRQVQQALRALQETTGLTGSDQDTAAELSVQHALSAGLAEQLARGLPRFAAPIQEVSLQLLAGVAAHFKDLCPPLHTAGLPRLVLQLLSHHLDLGSEVYLQGLAFLYHLSCCEELQPPLRELGLLNAAQRLVTLFSGLASGGSGAVVPREEDEAGEAEAEMNGEGGGSSGGSSGSTSHVAALLVFATGMVGNVYHLGRHGDPPCSPEALRTMAQYDLALALRDVLEALLHGDAQWQNTTWYLDSTVSTVQSLATMPEYASRLLQPPCDVLPLLLEVLSPSGRTTQAAKRAARRGPRVALMTVGSLLQLARFEELRGQLVAGGVVPVVRTFLAHYDARVVVTAQECLLELSHAPHDVLMETLQGVQSTLDSTSGQLSGGMAGLGQRLGDAVRAGEQLVGDAVQSGMQAPMVRALEQLERGFQESINKMPNEVDSQLSAPKLELGDALSRLEALHGSNQELGFTLGSMDGHHAELQQKMQDLGAVLTMLLEATHELHSDTGTVQFRASPKGR